MKLKKTYHALAMAGLMLVVACDAKNPAERPAVAGPASPVALDTTAAGDSLQWQPQDGIVVETPTTKSSPSDMKRGMGVSDEPRVEPRVEPVNTNTFSEGSAPETLQQRENSAEDQTPVKAAPKKKQQPLPKTDNLPAPAPRQEQELPAATFREGTYHLLSVQGDGLPLVMDMTIDCDTRLLQATLVLKDGGFLFESQTEEACKDTPTSLEKHEAAGSYRLEDGRIFLSIRYGDALGDASGIIETGGKLRLQHIGNEEESQEVDWVFALQ